jgi:3,4-dihydroxy-2-butanone 4-phosphate synthase
LFAKKHGLKMITIADLIKYRQQHKFEGDDEL